MHKTVRRILCIFIDNDGVLTNISKLSINSQGNARATGFQSSTVEFKPSSNKFIIYLLIYKTVFNERDLFLGVKLYADICPRTSFICEAKLNEKCKLGNQKEI